MPGWGSGGEGGDSGKGGSSRREERTTGEAREDHRGSKTCSYVPILPFLVAHFTGLGTRASLPALQSSPRSLLFLHPTLTRISFILQVLLLSIP